MVHDPKDINDAPDIIAPSDQAEAIISHIENDAVAHLIGRPKRLSEGRKVKPVRVFGCLVPCGKIPPG